LSGTKRKTTKPELRVVFDTNALYVTPTSIGSASDLVRQEIADPVSEPKYPDLDILWYLPEVVRHERQYQMQQEALRLRTAINKIERLLGHNLALTNQVLLDHVHAKIDSKEQELGLGEIKLDHGSVDWSGLIQAAIYRQPPFQAGEKEKGFRDALVVEAFLQLVAESPRSPRVCRVVLVTSDSLLAEAVKRRLSNCPNVGILGSIQELKGLINTIVSNVGEDFIAQLSPKASQMFFISSDAKDTLYFKEDIGNKLQEKFKVQLNSRPDETEFRKDGAWYIYGPNFSRKEGRRIYWTTRIGIETEAGVFAKEPEPNLYTQALLPLLSEGLVKPGELAAPLLGLRRSAYEYYEVSPPYRLSGSWTSVGELMGSVGKRVITHQGKDRYEVLWSTEVTQAKALRKSAIHDILHVELSWQPISSQSSS
jgi:hypothetical protein